MRSISGALSAAIARRALPHLWFLVEFAEVYSTGTTPLRLTNFTRSFVWGAKSWTPLPGIEGKGFGESLRLEVPPAALRLPALDASMQARFLADEFRGTRVTVTMISQEPASSIVDASQLWQTTYTIGPDAIDEDGVTLRLESADAVEGADVPRRQVSEQGCQEDYMRGGCPYRGHRVVASTGQPPVSGTGASPSMRTVVFESCSKQLQDVGTNPGCRSHFPAVLNPDWVSGGAAPRILKRPLPYSAWPGGVPGLVLV